MALGLHFLLDLVSIFEMIKFRFGNRIQIFSLKYKIPSIHFTAICEAFFWFKINAFSGKGAWKETVQTAYFTKWLPFGTVIIM